ncbi:MAG: STAS domain-containing protein [bacterium]
MKFSVRERKNVVIIQLDGEMVGGPDAALLSEELHDLIESGQNKIIVDMAMVDWMNSSGLGILIGGLTTVRNSGGDLKLLHLAKKLEELLRITKLQRVFEVFNDEGDAVASFS